MRKRWKITQEIRLEDGGQISASWNITTWNDADAIREVSETAKRAAKDQRMKGIKAVNISLSSAK